MKPNKLLSNPRLAIACDAFKRAAELSRKWDARVAQCVATYGEGNGTPISGIYREHFPENVKTELRDLAHSITFASENAWSLRPSRVRLATMRALRLAVRAEFGGGFYG